jgi:hypothetical protein
VTTLGISLGESSEQIKSYINSIKMLEKTSNLIFLDKFLLLDEGSASLAL